VNLLQLRDAFSILHLRRPRRVRLWCCVVHFSSFFLFFFPLRNDTVLVGAFISALRRTMQLEN
jgi:hypothetical protein